MIFVSIDRIFLSMSVIVASHSHSYNKVSILYLRVVISFLTFYNKNANSALTSAEYLDQDVRK